MSNSLRDRLPSELWPAPLIGDADNNRRQIIGISFLGGKVRYSPELDLKSVEVSALTLALLGVNAYQSARRMRVTQVHYLDLIDGISIKLDLPRRESGMLGRLLVDGLANVAKREMADMEHFPLHSPKPRIDILDHQIVTRVASGFTDEEIAASMEIDIGVVGIRLASITRRTAISTQVERPLVSAAALITGTVLPDSLQTIP